jgi:hypothetical protein
VLAENLTDFVLLIAIGFSAQLVDGAWRDIDICDAHKQSLNKILKDLGLK